MTYDPGEQNQIIDTFSRMLWAATKDGAGKRARGEKPPWYVDPSHERHFWNHVAAWKNDRLTDVDSGAHPLVHAAWRLLAIAYQERDITSWRIEGDRVTTLPPDLFAAVQQGGMSTRQAIAENRSREMREGAKAHLAREVVRMIHDDFRADEQELAQ